MGRRGWARGRIGRIERREDTRGVDAAATAGCARRACGTAARMRAALAFGVLCRGGAGDGAATGG
jgi:hypothetical protein